MSSVRCARISLRMRLSRKEALENVTYLCMKGASRFSCQKMLTAKMVFVEWLGIPLLLHCFRFVIHEEFLVRLNHFLALFAGWLSAHRLKESSLGSLRAHVIVLIFRGRGGRIPGGEPAVSARHGGRRTVPHRSGRKAATAGTAAPTVGPSRPYNYRVSIIAIPNKPHVSSPDTGMPRCRPYHHTSGR